MDENNRLDSLLAQIDGCLIGEEIDTGKLISECLNLLKRYRSSDSKGKIFAKIAFIYAQSGMKQPKKTIHYCREALKYPLQVDTACQMYIFWADALQVQYQDFQEQDFPSLRKKITRLCLSGLKLILDNLTTTEIQTVPFLSKFDYSGTTDNPAYQEILQQHNDEAESRKRAIFQNKLIEHHNVLMAKCVALYSQQPYAIDELRRLVSEIFKDDDDIKKFVAEIEARINQRSSQSMDIENID